MDFDGKQYCPFCMHVLPRSGLCPYTHERSQSGPTCSLDPGTLLQDRYQIAAGIRQDTQSLYYTAWDEYERIPVMIQEFFPKNLCHRNTAESDDVQIPPAHHPAFQDAASRFLVHDSASPIAWLACFPANQTCYRVWPISCLAASMSWADAQTAAQPMAT